MNYKTRAVAILFLLGMTFTSFSLIEAKQNLRVTSFGDSATVKNDECMIHNGSFFSIGTISPGPRISLGSCDDDYALDVEPELWNNDFYYLKITDSNGDSGCMSHDNNWLTANRCLEQTDTNNHVWELANDILQGGDDLCVEYIPDAETGNNLRMVGCDVVTTKFSLVDASTSSSSSSSSPSLNCSVDYIATKPIDKFQLKTVPGQERLFVSKDALTVHLYYEAHPDHATDDDLIDVTLYTVGDDAGATPGQDPWPCNLNGVALIDDAGTALYTVTSLVAYSGEVYNERGVPPTVVDQCFPRTINGAVGQAEIEMRQNPFGDSTLLSSMIYDTSATSEGQDGRLQFCARIAYLIGDDDDKELISYIDTKVVLDVSISAEIEFTQSVDIISSSDQTVNTVNQDVSTAIEVDSFLCGDPGGENDGAPYADSYSLGQAFRICVDVQTDDQDKFRLTNFGEVKCTADSVFNTTIISLVDDVATAASILTTLFDNDATAGAKSFDSETVASAQAISFSTVLTNAYFTGEDETLICVGSVDVETVAADTEPANAPSSSFASVQEYCENFGTGYSNYWANVAWPMEKQERSMLFNGPNRLCCDNETCASMTEADSGDTEYGPCGSCNNPMYLSNYFEPCSYSSDDAKNYMTTATKGACIVPAEALNQANRRQLVSFTVPNPVASSASSRRRMDEETGAAKADFGAIIKLSSSSSSSFAASGPFLLLWATTTLAIALVAGWSL